MKLFNRKSLPERILGEVSQVGQRAGQSGTVKSSAAAVGGMAALTALSAAVSAARKRVSK